MNTQLVWDAKDVFYTAFDGTPAELRSYLEEESRDITRETILRNIYYDFDRWNIREDAAARLDIISSYLLTGSSKSSLTILIHF